MEKELKELKEKVSLLEKKNESLVNENAQLKNDLYSNRLVELINCENFEGFSSLIEKVKFPINAYLSESTGKSEFNLLLFAISQEKVEFVKYLINNQKANINVIDKKEKWNCLMYAIEKKNVLLTKFLLDNGVNIDNVDVDGFTPLALAIDTQQEEIVRILLEKKPSKETSQSCVKEILKESSNEKIKKMVKDYFHFVKSSEDETSD